MSEQVEQKTDSREDWMNKKWRPAMGWMYMAVCVFDFIIFPILWAIVQFWETSAANDAFRQWNPLTLQGAGLFHMAMGAVLGIAAYGRTKEKLEGAAGGSPLPQSTPSVTPAVSNFNATPNLNTPTPSFAAPAASSFSASPAPATSFAPAPVMAPTPTAQPIAVTATGKKVVPQDPDPEL